MKFLIKGLIGFFIISSAIAFDNSAANTNEAAYKAIANYCKLEFLFEKSKRNDLFKTTPAYFKKNDLGDGSGVSPGDLSIGIDKIFVVNSYKILDIKVDKNKAVAEVSYNVLAKSEQYAKFYKYLRPNYIEKINLVFDGKQWWILDPPPPKISIDEILAFYEYELRELSHRSKENLDAIQLRNYEKPINTDQAVVNLLKSLGGDASKAVTPNDAKL
jgi:hypothetical protein